MSYLLIIANTPSINTQKIAEAAVNGARTTNYPVIFKTPLGATADDVLGCSGVILGTTENFGYMSGLIKDFLERAYYPCMGQTDALPWALYVKAGLDGTGAINSVQKVVSGMRWKMVQEPILLQGQFSEDFIREAEALGAGMAEGLQLGIF